VFANVVLRRARQWRDNAEIRSPQFAKRDLGQGLRASYAVPGRQSVSPTTTNVENDTDLLCRNPVHRSYDLTPKVLTLVHRRALAAQLDLARSLRLTCKTFSINPAICDAIFYEISVYATYASIHILARLSEHPLLSRHVRRVLFVHPLIEERLTVSHNYVEALYEQWGGIGEPCPYTHGQLKAGYELYCNASEKQELLLKYYYDTKIASCLKKLPRFSCVGFDKMTECYGRRHEFCNRTWMQEHHPGVLLERTFMDEENHDASNDFVTRIFNILLTASARPQEMVFIDGHGIGPNWDWQKVDCLLLSNLKKLDLHVIGASGAEERADPNWIELLKPLTVFATGLETLHIHIDFDLLDDDACIDDILQVRIPSLKDFHLDRFQISASAFANFLRAHPRLEELSHSTCWILTDQDWPTYWKSMHDHPALSRFTIVYERWEYHDNSTYLMTECPPDRRQELEMTDEQFELFAALYRYIHKKGMWTEALADEWPGPA
jgi:hypothetical protein